MYRSANRRPGPPVPQPLSTLATKATMGSVMAADVKMVQVHAATHERLTALKLPGLTYEDVINFALDHLAPEEIAAHYEAWQKDAMRRLAQASRPLGPDS